jgi:hypothetical protein
LCRPYRLSTALGCVRLANEALRGRWLSRLSANPGFTCHAALGVVLYDDFAAAFLDATDYLEVRAHRRLVISATTAA